MVSRFFIDRPVFAWVVALSIMLVGLLAITRLPIAEYPQIAPTSVTITATYPGADAQTVENSVTKVIEQDMNGIDHLQYMSSSSTSTGQATITLTFTNEANPDIAQVQVQNKLQLAEASLPQIVQQQGITVTKSTSSFLLVAGFVSTDDSLSATDIADYVSNAVKDPVSRITGVGEVRLFGSQYAMRIWLDPHKLAKYGLMPSDVVSAIQAQNTQVSAGEIGANPAVAGQQLDATISAQSRLQTPEQFRNIILRTNTAGSTVRLGDVARVELGAASYVAASEYNGRPAAGLAVSLATGANAVSTAAAVKHAIQELAPTMPKGLKVVYPYDTTPFVKLSIVNVVWTLLIAIGLVFVVMYVFLQNVRATLIPMVAVPVVLLGAFAVLGVLGYSINTLTMFAMVLAIGLLVDDAIVVVENVERVMAEEGLSPKEATRKSMGEITGALVGIATVLSAVFLPMAFFGGSIGVIYRQFSVTIVSAMLLSVLVALILTPALCATILSPAGHRARGGPFGLFNRFFEAASRAYGRAVAKVIARAGRFLVIFAAIVVAVGVLFAKLPTSFLPDEDQGIIMTLVQLPTGATQQRTQAVLDRIRDYYLHKEKKAVESVFTVAGFSFAGQGQNVGLAFVSLKDFNLRKDKALSGFAVARRAMAAFSKIRDAIAIPILPPSVPGFGTASGFDFYLEDQTNAGHDKLMQARNQLLGLASADKRLAGVRPNGQDDAPQFSIKVDQAKATALGISLADVDNTLSIAWGGRYVNDFIDRGRVKPVFVQGDAPFRMSPDQIGEWHVRTSTGAMAPFSAFETSKWIYGSPKLDRYNGLPAVEIQGQAAPGESSGAAMHAIDELMTRLPAGYARAWTGLSFQEELSGSQAVYLYVVSVLVVFLSLAALYESWSTPFAVMLAAPIGVFGALVAAYIGREPNGVYFQVGLLTTIGLAAKNAILIVEFALERLSAGQGLVQATVDASRQRLRPILMTSFAFMLGVLPLATATGAGSGSQNAIGIGVLGGMLAATFVGVFFVPLLFVAVRRLLPRPGRMKRAAGRAMRSEPTTIERVERV